MNVLVRQINTVYDSVTLLGNVCQWQHPPPPVFAPIMAAVTPPAGQNRPLPGEDVEVKAVARIQTTPVSKAAKGTESDAQYYTLKVNRGF